MEKFNFDELNKEFQLLLKQHENDIKFMNPEDEKFWKEYCGPLYEDVLSCCVYANAFQELCGNHTGLKDEADWYFGACECMPKYDNPWDVFVCSKYIN